VCIATTAAAATVQTQLRVNCRCDHPGVEVLVVSKLAVSTKTIPFQLQKIYEKLQVHSKTEAVAKAFRNGLV